MVESQIVNLTLSPSFCHNLCCKCPNGSWKAIFDIYTLIAFQWHEKCLKARCFDPYNWTLKFQESQRPPKSPFLGVWMSSSHPSKSGVVIVKSCYICSHCCMMNSVQMVASHFNLNCICSKLFLCCALNPINTQKPLN